MAVLDVNLDGEYVFPVAQELETRGIPFVLATGYGEFKLPQRWRERPCLRKPFTDAQLAELIGQLASRGTESRTSQSEGDDPRRA